MYEGKFKGSNRRALSELEEQHAKDHGKPPLGPKHATVHLVLATNKLT